MTTSVRWSVRHFITALFVLGSAAFSWGQTIGSGTMTGTVSDPSSAAIGQAAVVIHNTQTGTDRSIATNDAGVYVAQFLQPGSYEITVTKTGFAKTVHSGITLQVGQTLTLDFTMPIETTSETVTITADAAVIDIEKTEMSQVVTQTQKENLPIAGRRWEGFALLTPAVTTDGGTGLVSYRGISGLYNQSSVDGTNNGQAFFSETKGRTTLNYVYSMDALQEFQVSSNNYSAELGQAAGGVVNAITKSGTNTLHGGLFYYLRYPTWNALDPLQKSKGIYTQPVHQQQQFGGTLGGPIVKDKLFYFLNYEGFRKVNPISYTSSQFNGPQPCNALIPAATCAAANSFVQSQLGAFPRSSQQDVVLGKLNYSPNSSNTISASFNGVNYIAPNSYRTVVTQNNESPTSNGTAVTRERIFVANWEAIISPSMVNSFRFQWSQDLEKISANGTGPNVTITNFMSYGLPNALPRPAFPNEHRLQFADVLSKSYGRHTFKAGVDVNSIHEVLINLFQGGGVYSYSGANTFSNWVADVAGVNLGDGLTGRHFASFTQVTDPVTGVGKDDFRNNDVAAFFEDTWKVKRNLTLNLGLRWDVQMIPQPPMPNTLTPLTTYYTSKINIDKNNFAPRFGLAWSPDSKTVVRVGYGMFYAKTTNSTFYATRVENGVIQQTFICNLTNDPNACPALTFPNLMFTPLGGTPTAPFPGALTPVVTPFTPPTGTQTTRGQSPDWVNPLSHQGDITIERELAKDVTFSASYVVSRTLHLPMFYDANIAGATTTRRYDVVNGAGATQSSFTVPFYTTRLNPTTGPILAGVSDVNAWYHGLVLTGRKRMSKGLEIVANYTFSKATDAGQVPGQFGTFNGTDTAVDPYNRKLEYALSDLNQKQRFTGTAVWMPPYAQGIKNPFARYVLDGWSISSIAVLATGQPVTGTISGSPLGAIAGGPTGGAVNNSGAATGGRSPGIGRNVYTAPGTANVDLRISRTFPFGERVRLMLLGEAFNVFNWMNVYTVNTQQYTYTAAGTGACSGHANGCLVPTPTFLTPSATNTNLQGARQLQISGRITF